MFLFRFIWKIIKGFFFLILLVILGGALFLVNLPNISWLKNHNPQTTRFMEIYLDEWEDKGENPVIDHRWIPLSQISSHLKRGVMIAEDDAFYQHNGFDWKQIKESLKVNWKKKAFKRGGSTITQQLVKNLYLGPQKNIFRKIREWILTYQMEQTLTKDRILELYLNLIEWGPGVYGAEAACRYYFGTSAGSLSASQAAYLAAILPNPKLYGTARYKRKANWRANLIQKKMTRTAPRREGEKIPEISTEEETPLPDFPKEEESNSNHPEPLLEY